MSTVDPHTWLSLNLSQRGQQDVFKRQLVQYLQDQFTPGNLVTILNGANLLNAGALLVSGSNLGTLSTSAAFNCNGALINVVVFTFTAAITVTLNNLAIGAVAVIQTTCGATGRTLKFAATTPAGTAYSSILAGYAGGTSLHDMIASGLAYGANVPVTFVGASLTGPALPLVAS